MLSQVQLQQLQVQASCFFRASNVSLSISHIPSIFSSEGEMKVVLFGAVHYSQEKKTRAYVGIDEKIKDCLPRSYLIYH